MLSTPSTVPCLTVRSLAHSKALHANQGFTLLEVMVVVTVLAVLAALAGPSFMPLIERWSVREVSENMQSTLYFARSEAIKRGGEVTIQSKCAQLADTWKEGWQVCTGTTVLQTTAAPSRVTMASTGDTKGVITLDRWGQFGSALSFSFYPQGKDANDAAGNTICVSRSGQIKRFDQGSAPCS